MGKGPGKSSGTAPYHVALRAAERRILRETFEAFPNINDAAAVLGLTAGYLRVRAIHLGGVYKGQPDREPPGDIGRARVNARAEGANLPTMKSPLRRFGRELKRLTPTTKKAKHVEQRIGDDPVQRVSSDPGSTPESGSENSGAGDGAAHETDRSE